MKTKKKIGSYFLLLASFLLFNSVWVSGVFACTGDTATGSSLVQYTPSNEEHTVPQKNGPEKYFYKDLKKAEAITLTSGMLPKTNSLEEICFIIVGFVCMIWGVLLYLYKRHREQMEEV